MDVQLLIEPVSAAIVIGGTALVTLVRSGMHDSGQALRQIACLFHKRFDLAIQRAELAAQVELMRHDGIMRGEPGPLSDSELTDATAALVRHRSTSAMIAEHQRHLHQRETARETALVTLRHAAEIAPVLGLAGTLLALSQLPATGLGNDGAIMGSVSVAVVSTFYGLLLAHLVFHPLAAAIERRGRLEEASRKELMQWLVRQLQPACPSTQLPESKAA